MNRSPDAWAAVRGSPLRFLLSAWPWRCVAYLGSTVVTGLVALAALSVVLGVGVLTLVVVVGALVLAGVPRLTALVAGVERRRVGWVLPDAGTTVRTKVLAPSTGRKPPHLVWSEIGYTALLATVLWFVDLLILIPVVGIPVILLLVPLLTPLDVLQIFTWRIDTTGEANLAGLVLAPISLVCAAYLITILAVGQAALAQRLLDPRPDQLAAAVNQLRRSRVDLVESFEGERRRIERDLHDGVQQRLLALGVTLGRAELDVPDGAGLELVRQAHRQADQALEELRTTVRGIHPRVLADHGLEAAVHEVADRSPVPVDTQIALPRRLPPPVEAAAYFVVSEALTNIIRHASAGTARINASVHGHRLIVSVVDDGVGGASVTNGGGLAGLALRLEALDGELQVTSPAGGPTEVRMECPVDAG